MVSPRYGVSATGEGTLENAVVWLVLYDRQSPAGLDAMRNAREKYCDVRELFGVAGESACKYSKQLVKNRLGKNDLVLLFDDPAQRRLRASRR